MFLVFLPAFAALLHLTVHTSEPFIASEENTSQRRFGFLVGAIFSFAFLAAASMFILPSGILRAHLAAVLCCRPRDRLSHSFHCSLWEPPFRPRPRAGHTAADGLFVPACFLRSRASSSRTTAPAEVRSMQMRAVSGAI